MPEGSLGLELKPIFVHVQQKYIVRARSTRSAYTMTGFFIKAFCLSLCSLPVYREGTYGSKIVKCLPTMNL